MKALVMEWKRKCASVFIVMTAIKAMNFFYDRCQSVASLSVSYLVINLYHIL